MSDENGIERESLIGHRDGETYEPELDYSRLNAQQIRVARVMVDGQWRTLREIEGAIERRFDQYDSQASISARLRDLRKEKFGGHTVERRRRDDARRGVFEYRLLVAPTADELGQTSML